MQKVLVVDYGSQYTMLISRRVREAGVFCEIINPKSEDLVEKAKNYDAIILSGGPSSVFEENALSIDKEIFNIGVPILGTCYGMQLIHHMLGGKVETLEVGEYGKINITLDKDHDVETLKLIDGINDQTQVWMSHHDSVTEMAPGFSRIAYTDAAISMTANPEKKIYTIQFHSEVEHTVQGKQMIENFLFKIAGLQSTWKPANIIEEKLEYIKKTVGDDKVILGLSGGVDSSVLAVLLSKAIGSNLIPIFIDNGLLRKNEVQNVKEMFDGIGIKINIIDAKERFYAALKGITEPEAKRKAIGRVFVEEFTKAKAQFKDANFLAQGTIYPDVIESSGTDGNSHTIKSHHNVGGLPEELEFELLEPFRDLFKDEVRRLGTELGLPSHFINRHPFPGPGLGIRIIGEVNAERVRILQDVDHILMERLMELGIYWEVSQAAAILTPIQTVGVQGDERTYANLAAFRIVKTTDFMTATFARVDFDTLDAIATEVINKVAEVNRVVYDITSKPPGTIEWE